MGSGQKDMERRLRFSDFTIEQVRDSLFWVDSHARFVRVNEAACRSLGYSMEDLCAMKVHDIDLDVTEERWPEHWRTLRRDKNRIFESRQRSKDGRVFPIEVSENYIEFEGEEYTCSLVRDISGRKRVEEELVRLAAAVEQADEAIVIADTARTIRYVNPAVERIWGFNREEIVGCPVEVGFGQRVANEIRERTENGEVWRGHIAIKRKDGSVSETETTVSPIRDGLGKIISYVGVTRDVTEQIKLEARLAQSQKIEAIGTLAGGIAHDFNNILTPIIGYAQLLLDGIDGPLADEQCHDLERIVAAGMRAQDMVGQILTFARKGEHDQEFHPIHVSPIIKETLKLLRASLPTTIEIHSRIEAAEDMVRADPTQIHQVLLNLCTNASHAIGDEPGSLDVALSDAEVDDECAARHPDLAKGHYLRLTVSDTGCGMRPEVAARIFEPFFTTKGPGEGTGMGLAVVHGIVKNHAGAIFVYSEPGQGTTFQVFLPKAESVERMAAERKEPIPRGDERVLFVDDEEVIVELVRKIMEGLGYRVVTTTSSIKALERFRENPQEFDLVVSDLTMPKMTGISLLREIARIRPDLPTILCTGFSGTISLEKAKAVGVREVVLKPLTTRGLGCAVRRALDLRKD